MRKLFISISETLILLKTNRLREEHLLEDDALFCFGCARHMFDVYPADRPEVRRIYKIGKPGEDPISASRDYGILKRATLNAEKDGRTIFKPKVGYLFVKDLDQLLENNGVDISGISRTLKPTDYIFYGNIKIDYGQIVDVMF